MEKPPQPIKIWQVRAGMGDAGNLEKGIIGIDSLKFESVLNLMLTNSYRKDTNCKWKAVRYLHRQHQGVALIVDKDTKTLALEYNSDSEFSSVTGELGLPTSDYS